MTEVMVDIETLGNQPGSVILSIGAVSFDPWKNDPTTPPPGVIKDHDDVILSRFEALIDIEGAGSEGLHIDRSTAKWWLQSTPEMEAARSALQGNLLDLSEALWEFSLWIRTIDPEPIPVPAPSRSGPSFVSLSLLYPATYAGPIWAWPPSFDLAILGAAYDALHFSRPWKRRMERDARTVAHLANLSGSDEAAPKVGTRHRAQDDAEAQAILLSRALRALQR